VCQSREFEVHLEPNIRVVVGLWKSDIIAKLGVTAMIIDAKIVNDQVDLDRIHNLKNDYYKNIERNIRDMYTHGN